MVIVLNGLDNYEKHTLINDIPNQIGITPTSTTKKNFHDVYIFGYMDAIKAIAKAGGWLDDYSDKGKTLLNRLKIAFENYNNTPLEIIKRYVLFYTSPNNSKVHKTEPICFVCVTETEDIRKIVNEFKKLNIKTATMFITDESSEDDCLDYAYDYVFIDKKDDLLESAFNMFIEYIVRENLY